MSGTAEERPLGPRGMAIELAKNIERFEAELAAAATKAEQKRLRALLKLNRKLLAFCKTRAEY